MPRKKYVIVSGFHAYFSYFFVCIFYIPQFQVLEIIPCPFLIHFQYTVIILSKNEKNMLYNEGFHIRAKLGLDLD